MENRASLKTKLSDNILTVMLDHLVPYTQCVGALREVMQEVYDNSAVKGVIITGTEQHTFSMGASPNEMQGLNELNGRKFTEHGQEVFSLIEGCHKPILAAINGNVQSGGLALALACHLRVAVEQATFCFPEVTMGVIPHFGSTQRLTHLIGKTKALEFMMMGIPITAMEAKRLKLINHVVDDRETLMQKGETILKHITMHAPLAVGMLINCINAVHNNKEGGYQIEANSFSHCFKTEDLKEGILAKLEDRSPIFQGK